MPSVLMRDDEVPSSAGAADGGGRDRATAADPDAAACGVGEPSGAPQATVPRARGVETARTNGSRALSFMGPFGGERGLSDAARSASAAPAFDPRIPALHERRVGDAARGEQALHSPLGRCFASIER